MNDTIDKEFRKLALNAQNLDGSAMHDLSNFVIMMSDQKTKTNKKGFESDRQHKKTWKIMDQSKIDHEGRKFNSSG